VPEDIVALRRSDPTLARAWRRALRETLGDAIQRGYVVVGATRDGWYVLESATA
jgi:predicted GNAT superfamily acetyltransferase